MEWWNDLRAGFESSWLLFAAPVVVGALAFWIGRRSGPGATEVRHIEAELEDAHKELERRSTELEASREALEGYRASVTQHFEGTSERLHELTLQYREMYEHLSEGARALCPDGFEALDGGLGLDALPEESGRVPDEPEPELETDEDPERL